MCALMPGGHAKCGYHCRSAKFMMLHLTKGKHMTRRRGGHAVDTVVNHTARVNALVTKAIEASQMRWSLHWRVRR